ncbi:ABC-type transport system, ATPase component [Lentisphaera araneosa HTCC2155]|uniref:ABC-type transport system, ATPase component n=1 Tax=Lentisphaera araneosa HTCC2155 TaxID=313628 RepID=A6DTV2_9BACT|nr:ATP-binding cassette domain-containing protein [Lentisphaera araneosa]EDM24921.1 ABC-type transport system, ATPase component [Lentisphaera araneosa HTCC2155]
MEAVIKVDKLKMGYGDRVIMECLDFEIKQGEIFIILGGSGCGKSTLLKHMIGLYKPMAGDITIKGKNIVKADAEKKRDIMKEFGVMYQSGALFGSMTLEENITMILEEVTDMSPQERHERAMEKLALVELDEFNTFYPAEISGGMKKRAAIARAMALNPDILFFDEPSAGLDPISAANLDALILKLREEFKTTIVIVTHELESIFSIADRIIMLDKETKRIIEDGDPRKLKNESKNEWVRDFLNRRESVQT